jgi:hypothetical protein
LLVILNPPGAIAVGAVLTITYPATAITMWANLFIAGSYQSIGGTGSNLGFISRPIVSPPERLR